MLTSSNSINSSIEWKLFACWFIWFVILHNLPNLFIEIIKKDYFSAICFQIWAFHLRCVLHCVEISSSNIAKRCSVKVRLFGGHCWCYLIPPDLGGCGFAPLVNSIYTFLRIWWMPQRFSKLNFLSYINETVKCVLSFFSLVSMITKLLCDTLWKTYFQCSQSCLTGLIKSKLWIYM